MINRVIIDYEKAMEYIQDFTIEVGFISMLDDYSVDGFKNTCSHPRDSGPIIDREL